MLRNRLVEVANNKRFNKIPQIIIDETIELFIYACESDENYQDSIKNNTMYVAGSIRDIYMELNKIEPIEFLTLKDDEKINYIKSIMPKPNELNAKIFEETFVTKAFFRKLESYINQYRKSK